jgi:hypothetical protein
MAATGSRGQPLKMAQYLADGKRLAEAVNAYRAARGDDEATPPPGGNYNKPKSYRLPPLDRPTPIPGFPFTESPPTEAPNYGTIGRVKAIKFRQRRLGARAPVKPGGPSELRKRSQ